MEPSFNPYREWLRIPDGLRPANYYSLFGLKAFESDLNAIAQAADHLRAMVRNIQPGPHKAHWERLLDEIAAAKACLTNPQTKAAYDATMRATPVMQGHAEPAAPPSPGAGHRPYAAPPADHRRSVDPLGAMPAPSAGSRPGPKEMASSPAPPPVAKAVVATHAAPPPPPAHTPGGSAGAGHYASSLSEVPPVSSPVLVAQPLRAAPAAAPVPWHQGPLGYALALVVVIGMGVAAYVVTPMLTQPPASSQGDSPTPVASGTPASEGAPPAAANAGSPSTAAAQPNSGTADAGMTGASAPSSPMGGNDAPGSPAKSADMAALPATPAATEQAKQPDKEKQAQFRKVLSECRTAWSNRKLPDGKRLLDEAQSLAQTDEEKDLVHRLENLEDWLGKFWEMIDRRTPSLKQADEIDVGKTRIIIVEFANGILTYKDEGRVEKHAIRELPGRVVIALAEAWLGKDAGTQMIFSAFLVLDREGDPQRAEKIWSDAAKEGMKVDKLLPDLSQIPLKSEEPAAKPRSEEPKSSPESKPAAKPETKPAAKPTESAKTPPKAQAKAPAVAAGEKKPPKAPPANRIAKPTDAAKLQEAEKALQERFGAQIEIASTPIKKTVMARNLLAASKQAGEPEANYVLLNKAMELGIGSGKVELTWEIITQITDTFELDPWELKAAAMERWAEAAHNPDTRNLVVCREVTTGGLKAIEEAVAAGHRPEAVRMAKAVLETAQHTENPAMVKQAATAAAGLGVTDGK